MEIFRTSAQYNEYVVAKSIKNIGFVPTMGFLHDGHLSLVKKCKSENDFCVVSVFVNPIQFNNKTDLEKYPRDEKHDIELLEKVNCDAVFIPSVEEMYPAPATEIFSFHGLENTMEGSFRPGHFNGVAIVVSRLFKIIKPSKAYFGLKDYQQYLIIKEMAKDLFPQLSIVGMPIIRESNGLAKSSRNVRIAPENRDMATLIFELMNRAKQLKIEFSPAEISVHITKMLENGGFKPDYVEIVDGDTLKTLSSWNESKKPRIFIAAYLGDVRLIDNMAL